MGVSMSDRPRRRRVLGAPPAPGERLIRKYGNRRLYDTEASRYVTLEDLVDVFAGDEPVRVVDAVSGEDLTKRVLAQAILFEEERRRSQIIPLPMLRALLRHRGDEVFERKLARAMAELDVAPLEPAQGEAAGGAPFELAELKRRLKALESQLKPPPARRKRG
jgi:polyhydroxyalkanoate synthesis repressor PhaR